MRRFALPLIAVLLVAAVLGAQVAAGGGDYLPRRPANPCTPRPIPPIQPRLETLAARIVLLGLDSAACRLGISSERLVIALAEPRSLNSDAPAALKVGLLDAVEQLDRAGRLPSVSQLLPDALSQAGAPGIVGTIAGVIPGGLVDSALPIEPLLHRTIDALDVTRLLHELNDPGHVKSAVEAAVLHAALGEILARLRP